ncbi:anaerobic nitric oxide reductase flavorubredoxin [Peptococcaceae bacterium 1198_IL3148]
MINIKDNIYWLGIRDWETRTFHGTEYSTHRGTSFNSYLIKDEKVVLVDTVFTPFHKQFIDLLEEKVGLDKIDLLVVNHTEPDHSGAMPYLLDKRPDLPIYCSKNGAMIIKKHYHKDWNFQVVKTGDTVDLGKNKLIFVEMPMLHWPDSMATYVSGANVLLSNDAFGQHYAAPQLYNDLVDQCELSQESLKYYANILAPFNKLVKAKIKEIVNLNLPIEMIAPSHGVIWRDNPMQIVEKYNEWADNYHEGIVTILYDTMYGATKKMALAIADGLESNGVTTKVFNVGKWDKNDVIAEVYKSKGIIVGSSTINRGILSAVAAILEIIEGLKLQGKIGASFGASGWSAESPKIIEERLRSAGIEIVSESIGVQYNPAPEDLQKCVAYGAAFAERVKN